MHMSLTHILPEAKSSPLNTTFALSWNLTWTGSLFDSILFENIISESRSDSPESVIEGGKAKSGMHDQVGHL